MKGESQWVSVMTTLVHLLALGDYMVMYFNRTSYALENMVEMVSFCF